MNRKQQQQFTRLAYNFHGIAYYNMGDFDKLVNVIPLEDIKKNLSQQFNHKCDYFWINPKTKAIESLYSLHDLEHRYNSIFHANA